MKKLTRVFQTKKGALREAVREDDIALMEKLMGKKSDFLIFELFKPEVIEGMTPRMADTIVKHVQEGKRLEWGGGRGHEGAMMVTCLFTAHAASVKNYALLDVFFDGRLDFCADKASASVLRDLIGSDMDAEKKIQYLKKILSGKNKLSEHEKAVEKAVETSDLEALDILASSGINLRENNEFWLREAAKNDKRHVAARIDIAFACFLKHLANLVSKVPHGVQGLRFKLKADTIWQAIVVRPWPCASHNPLLQRGRRHGRNH